MGKQGASRWGRMMRVGLVVVAGTVLSASLALANEAPPPSGGSTSSSYGAPVALNEAPPQEDVFSDTRPIAPPPWNRAVSADLSLGSLLINTLFFPVKLVVGIAGAEVGGLAGAMNGGDEEAARGIWNVTTDGSYYVTPADLDGRSEFTLGGDAP
jgi:hypothetical protein